jgi:hypothetical protein
MCATLAPFDTPTRPNMKRHLYTGRSERDAIDGRWTSVPEDIAERRVKCVHKCTRMCRSSEAQRLYAHCWVRLTDLYSISENTLGQQLDRQAIVAAEAAAGGALHQRACLE